MITCGILEKSGVQFDKATEPKAARNAIQRAAAGELERSDQIEPTNPRGLLRFGQVVISTDLPNKAYIAVPFADLTREIDQIAMPAKRDEVCDGSRHVG